MCFICCPCITHYKDVTPPDIGGELIDSHDASTHTMTGDTMPLVEIQIPPQHTMVGEPGAMCYFQDGVRMESKFDDGARVDEPGPCFKCKMNCARCCSGEAMSMVHFTNDTNGPRTVAFGGSIPSSIIAVALSDVPDNILFTMNGSFIFGAQGTRIDVVRSDCQQCCFGAGLCFQKIDGNGVVFLSGGGTVIRQELQDETHRVDPASLLAFTTGLDVSVKKAGTCLTMCCGGEGLGLTTLSGTGSYWLASSPTSEQISYAVHFLPPKK